MYYKIELNVAKSQRNTTEKCLICSPIATPILNYNLYYHKYTLSPFLGNQPDGRGNNDQHETCASHHEAYYQSYWWLLASCHHNNTLHPLLLSPLYIKYNNTC